MRYAADRLRSAIFPVEPVDPVVWIQENVDLTYDTTSSADGLVDLSITPYLKKPLSCWNNPKVRFLTIMAVEQTGKSSTWRFGVLWAACNRPVAMLIIYPSDDDAKQINTDTLLPLMMGIPELKAELERPWSHQKDHYSFTKLKIYFQGAGSPIISKSIGIVVGDETDDWPTHLREKNVKNMQKRTRTYQKSLNVAVCSPSTKNGPIFVRFDDSSQEFYHLVCLKCDEFFPSFETGNLKYEVDERHKVIGDVRLKCPKCDHLHHESDKRRISMGGEYIGKFENEEEHRGFQWGALASTTISWREIAQAHHDSTIDFSREVQALLWNSYKGLPFRPETTRKSDIDALRRHIIPKRKEELVGIFLSADTQDDMFYWIVRGIDRFENTYLLGHGIAQDFDDLLEVWERDFDGRKCIAAIIDQGGHRARAVQEFTKEHPGIYSYKGDNRISKRYQPGKDDNSAIIAKPQIYQAELLYLIYTQLNKQNHYWYLSKDVTADYLEQLASVQATNTKNGDWYENWESTNGNDHYFDAEKMWLVMLEFAKDRFNSRHWFAKAPYVKQGSNGRRRTPDDLNANL